MKEKKAIVWFRQDLRVHDNIALSEAISHADNIIPVYVFDTRVFCGKTHTGFPKTDKYRAQFVIESVFDLSRNLEKLGSKLIIRIGKPEEEIYDIASKAKTSVVYCNRERTDEELRVQDKLEEKLWSIGQEIRYSRGKLLYHTQDLPFPVTHTPDIFTQFRKEVEKMVHIRDPYPVPTQELKPPSQDIDSTPLPSILDFGHEEFQADPRAALVFKGGESAALDRLDYYLFQSKNISTYKETRNGMVGGDYSSKFSPWLAQGCLSPKKIYQSIKKYESEHGANKSTYWLYFELMWRDFFRLIAK